METFRLNIEQQRAAIGIDIQRAQLHVEMPERKMSINWEPPRMEIHRENGSVDIDMEALKDNLGLKNYAELTKEAASKAHADALEAIRSNVNAAAFIGDVSKHGPKIGMSAKNEMINIPPPQTERSPVPPNVPMEGKPGELQIEWIKGGITIDWEGGGLPEVYVEPPHSVEVYLSQRPMIRVSVAEESIPVPTGRTVSAEV